MKNVDDVSFIVREGYMRHCHHQSVRVRTIQFCKKSRPLPPLKITFYGGHNFQLQRAQVSKLEDSHPRYRDN